jgi:hypothetical protein
MKEELPSKIKALTFYNKQDLVQIRMATFVHQVLQQRDQPVQTPVHPPIPNSTKHKPEPNTVPPLNLFDFNFPIDA